VVEQVRASLPARLATAVVSAGVLQGRLTIGVAGAVWASRLRYLTEYVRKRVGSATGIAIVSVRIRVVPPLPAQPLPAQPLPAQPLSAKPLPTRPRKA